MIKVTSRIEPIIKQKTKLPKIKTFNKNLGELVTTHTRDSYSAQWIKTEVKNMYNKSLGHEMYSFNSDSQTGTGATMLVEREYRQKGFKIGEILRLSSIMGIIENDISEFEIYSKPTSIFFHSKYKFEPAITSFEERNAALLTIINNAKEGFEEFRTEAEELLEESYRKNTPEIQRNLCKETNLLLEKYIEKIIKTDNYKNFPFRSGIRMVLTREKIIQNKDFFNSLFAKHGIDYKI